MHELKKIGFGKKELYMRIPKDFKLLSKSNFRQDCFQAKNRLIILNQNGVFSKSRRE